MARNVRRVVCGAMLLALVVQPSAGCSLFLVEPPPKPPKREPYVYCHQSQRIPTLDGLAAGLAGSGFVYGLAREEGWEMVITAAVATLFAISSGVGAGWVQDCQAWHKAPVIPLITTPGPPPARQRPSAADGPIVAPVDPDPPDPPDGGAP
jgi:hypothetical protein